MTVGDGAKIDVRGDGRINLYNVVGGIHGQAGVVVPRRHVQHRRPRDRPGFDSRRRLARAHSAGLSSGRRAQPSRSSDR